MERKLTFHNMPSSAPMENIIHEKLNKIDELIKDPEWTRPKYIELWLKANSQHPHHEVGIHLKTPQLELDSHAQGTKMYVVIDEAIDKMITLLKREKTKIKDKIQKTRTDKKDFGKDKYNL